MITRRQRTIYRSRQGRYYIHQTSQTKEEDRRAAAAAVPHTVVVVLVVVRYESECGVVTLDGTFLFCAFGWFVRLESAPGDVAFSVSL